ncbi:hypothetical protein JMN32_03560 [Fulvivirga sp. 29W222]|uniref:Uncharacterized protein n=1 Tax=Fulvivirga marina TaxID=2494733 RepID=A0A937KCM0_9BACT|nr:hypothetical protein [Fulvivirga marina]MBL6445368.1 hypothetical protein [Fulvivirga marina]
MYDKKHLLKDFFSDSTEIKVVHQMSKFRYDSPKIMEGAKRQRLESLSAKIARLM